MKEMKWKTENRQTNCKYPSLDLMRLEDAKKVFIKKRKSEDCVLKAWEEGKHQCMEKLKTLTKLYTNEIYFDNITRKSVIKQSLLCSQKK